MDNITHIRLGFWGPEVDPPLHSLVTQLINQYSFFAATILGVTIAFFTLYPVGHHRQYAPPGPPRLPLLGNLLQVPRQFQFLKFTEWSQQYGT